MSVCPKCKAEIDCLFWDRYPHQEGTLNLNKDGTTEIDEEFNTISMQEAPSIYSCPNCSKELTRDDEEAEEILKDKDELKEIVAKKLKKMEKENANNKRKNK